MDVVGWILAVIGIPIVLYTIHRMRERDRLSRMDEHTAAAMEARRRAVAQRYEAARADWM